MSLAEDKIQNISYWKERVDLAAAFRWAARFDLHEGVANHFSFSINDSSRSSTVNDFGEDAAMCMQTFFPIVSMSVESELKFISTPIFPIPSVTLL